MLDTINDRGIDLLDINIYIEKYRRATQSYDSGFLNPERTIHIFDIFDNFINDYQNKNTVPLKLKDNEIDLYKYNPKALSYKILGTPDFYALIMMMNDISHPGEMDFSKPMRVPTKQAFEDFYNELSKIKQNLDGGIFDIKDRI